MNHQYILFYSSTCGPCEDIRPLIKEFSKTHTITQIEDNDDNDIFFDTWNVNYLPTLLVLTENTQEIIKTITGVDSIEKYIHDITKSNRTSR